MRFCAALALCVVTYVWAQPDPPLQLTVGETSGFDPVAAHEALLAEATGYFVFAGGNGGQGGEVVYVSNLNDSGSGSLRSFVEQSGPLIILFEDGVDGTITLDDQLVVASDKTIWGRHRDGSSADIFIHPVSSADGFRIFSGARDVIIANLKGDAIGPNDSAPDLVFVSGSVVWVHHVTGFGNLVAPSDIDDFVDVSGGTDVTISWCRIEDWVAPVGLRGGGRVTLHHNLYRHDTARQPRTTDGMRAHNYNNWLDSWFSSGMSPNSGSEILVENNIFDADTEFEAIKPGGGSWGGSGNVFTNGAMATTSPVAVFTPPYPYTLDSTDNLRDILEAEAGWQATNK